jgi:iron uptake system component EfeO
MARRLVATTLVAGLGLAAAACTRSDDAAEAKGAIAVEITDAGCQPKPSTATSGEVTFEVTNGGSDDVTEAELLNAEQDHILGENEHVTPGKSASFTVVLAEGTYKMKCPGAIQDTWDFTVTKGAVVKDWRQNPALVKAVKGYSDYVDEQTAELAKVTKAFTDAVRAGEVDKAKGLYGRARVPYERIEPVAESFGDLDPSIDGRADDGLKPTELTGFHRLEYALWVEESLDGMKPIADQLDADIVKLRGLVAEKSGSYIPEEVTNGATELMNEVMAGKMPGEEERYSHTDLIDFQANLDGSMKSIDLVRPALEKAAPDVLAEIDADAAKVQEALDAYKEDPGYAGTGFRQWGYVDDPRSVITPAQRRALSDVVKPLVEHLAEVPTKVAR